MTKALLIVLFNIAFGFASGFITSRIFTLRDRGQGKWYAVDKEDRKMIFSIVLACFIVGALFALALPKKKTIWMAAGMSFGSLIPWVSFFFIHVWAQYDELTLRPKRGMLLDTKLNFLKELYRSFRGTEYLITAMFVSLYGWLSLLVPLLGLAWGYVMYQYLVWII